MNRFQWLLTGLLVAVGGCSNRFESYSDYDPSVNILSYKSYAWPSKAEMESRVNPLLYNELTDKRIREAVNQQLDKNGYRLSDSAAALSVHYHVVVRDKVIYRGDLHAGSYGEYWMERGRSSIRYEEGTLIVDLMDAANGNLVWRGWAVGVIEEYTTTLTEEEIAEAVTRIFENYPRRRTGK